MINLLLRKLEQIVWIWQSLFCLKKKKKTGQFQFIGTNGNPKHSTCLKLLEFQNLHFDVLHKCPQYFLWATKGHLRSSLKESKELSAACKLTVLNEELTNVVFCLIYGVNFRSMLNKTCKFFKQCFLKIWKVQFSQLLVKIYQSHRFCLMCISLFYVDLPL